MNKRIRNAVRAIVLNKKNEVLLIYSSKNDFYQLPGGGVNDSEDSRAAVLRETLEETGYQIEITRDLGIFEEESDDMTNRTTGYLCSTVIFTQKSLNIDEIDFINEWTDIDTALMQMNRYLTDPKFEDYRSFYSREIFFLQRAKTLIE